LFIYCIAVLAKRYNIAVHAAVVMSTHEHLIVTDTRGMLPCFLQELHRLLALSIKVLRKWEGAVWDHEKTSVVELRTREAVLEKLAYVMANPVAAGLVRHAHEWPGVTTQVDELGRAQWSAPRPSVYFDATNPAWPARATLELTMPELDIADDDARAVVGAELQALELAAAANVKRNGWSVLGRKRLATLSPFERATSWEALRSRNPTFAVGRGQREAFFEAVAVLRAFRNAYRAARELWRAGLREALFPVGSWHIRCAHGAAVTPA
jgi:REP element-mobilizing transposase RayT